MCCAEELDRLDSDYQNAVDVGNEDALLIWDEWVAMMEGSC